MDRSNIQSWAYLLGRNIFLYQESCLLEKYSYRKIFSNLKYFSYQIIFSNIMFILLENTFCWKIFSPRAMSCIQSWSYLRTIPAINIPIITQYFTRKCFTLELSWLKIYSFDGSNIQSWTYRLTRNIFLYHESFMLEKYSYVKIFFNLKYFSYQILFSHTMFILLENTFFWKIFSPRAMLFIQSLSYLSTIPYINIPILR